MPTIPPAEQLERIKATRFEELLPEDEFIPRLQAAIRSGRPLRVKQGFDPTAPDIHLGHAVGLRKLREFQDMGHQVVLIVGDYTGLVGDPSGRSATRPQLSQEEIEKNAGTYLEQFFKVVDEARTEVHRNSEWFEPMGMRDVIRLCARYTLARMLERDDFTKRFSAGHPISVHELLYPLMQGFDSVMIRCDLELGATEQKFNLLVGRALQEDYARGEMAWCEPYIPEVVKRVPVPRQGQLVLTTPILVGTDGAQRMSKSLGNYIGVSEPANIMYEKLMRVPDGALRDYFRLCVDFPIGSWSWRDVEQDLDEADTVRSAGFSTAGLAYVAKHGLLASEIVRMYHGKAAADAAGSQYGRLGGIGKPGAVKVVELPGTEEPSTWIGYIAAKAGLCKSTSEARRLLEQQGLHWMSSSTAGGQEVWLAAMPDQAVPSSRGSKDFYLRKGKRQETTVRIVWT